MRIGGRGGASRHHWQMVVNWAMRATNSLLTGRQTLRIQHLFHESLQCYKCHRWEIRLSVLFGGGGGSRTGGQERQSSWKGRCGGRVTESESSPEEEAGPSQSSIRPPQPRPPAAHHPRSAPPAAMTPPDWHHCLLPFRLPVPSPSFLLAV